MKILVFDNYDSFTYNLVHLVKELGYSDVEVIRNDKINLEEVARFDKIILSPGPGIPSEAGLLSKFVEQYAAKKSILGVCLGHQAIGEAFGARLINLDEVCHGIATKIQIVNEDYIFNDLESCMDVGRYHSWVVDRNDFPDCLQVTAVDNQGEIMAIKHREYDVHGVQFHPESVLTPEGKTIIGNFLKEIIKSN